MSHIDPHHPQPAWSVRRLATATGHSLRMIRRRIRNGELPARKFGKSYRIPADIACAIVSGAPDPGMVGAVAGNS